MREVIPDIGIYNVMFWLKKIKIGGQRNQHLNNKTVSFMEGGHKNNIPTAIPVFQGMCLSISHLDIYSFTQQYKTIRLMWRQSKYSHTNIFGYRRNNLKTWNYATTWKKMCLTKVHINKTKTSPDIKIGWSRMEEHSIWISQIWYSMTHRTGVFCCLCYCVSQQSGTVRGDSQLWTPFCIAWLRYIISNTLVRKQLSHSCLPSFLSPTEVYLMLLLAKPLFLICALKVKFGNLDLNCLNQQSLWVFLKYSFTAS